MRRVVPLILLCVLFDPGVAAASSNGSLTRAEFTQLTNARKDLSSVNLKTPAGLRAALRDCEKIQKVSPLVTAIRSGCVAQIRFSTFPAVVKAVVAQCSAFTTVAERFKCMTPTYTRLYGITLSYYRADSLVHRIAASRHLTAACTTFLSDPPRVIAAEKRMVTAFASMLAAMKAGDVLDVEKYSGELTTAGAEVQQGQNGSKGQLSLCAHQ